MRTIRMALQGGKQLLRMHVAVLGTTTAVAQLGCDGCQLCSARCWYLCGVSWFLAQCDDNESSTMIRRDESCSDAKKLSYQAPCVASSHLRPDVAAPEN